MHVLLSFTWQCVLYQTSGSMSAQLMSGENYLVHGTVDGSGQIAHTIRASPATVSNFAGDNLYSLMPEMTIPPVFDFSTHMTSHFDRATTSLETTHNINTHLMALCPGLPSLASTRKVKPIWILLKQETVSGIGISWTMCKSVSHLRPHHSFFYRPDALPATQPTASKH